MDLLINKCRQKFGEQKVIMFGPEKQTVVAKLPYIGAASVIVQRELLKLAKRYRPNIELKIVYNGVSRIGNFFHNKDKLDFRFVSKVVYGIKCFDCDRMYYGSTIRLLSARMREHALALKGKGHSSAADHCLEHGHAMDFQKPSILARDNSECRLRYKETLLIRNYADNLLNAMDSSIELHVFV
jgi:hypothetical protein